MVKPWLPAVAAEAMILAGQAFAQAKLLSTSPSAGAQLEVAPESLTLNFNENARLAVLTLTAGGKVIPVTVDRSAPAAPRIRVVLPVLAPSTYQVQWSVLSPTEWPQALRSLRCCWAISRHCGTARTAAA